jgi:hypothetical protein
MHDVRKLKKGRVCVYYRITERWGVKLFTDKDTRDRTYSLDSWAAASGLAPRVRCPFSARNCFGYAVEHCTATDATDEQLWLLTLKLRNLGLKTNDVNQRNTGLLRGSLVLFDFDLCYPENMSGATSRAAQSVKANGDILVNAANRRLSLTVPGALHVARSRDRKWSCRDTASGTRV